MVIGVVDAIAVCVSGAKDVGVELIQEWHEDTPHEGIGDLLPCELDPRLEIRPQLAQSLSVEAGDLRVAVRTSQPNDPLLVSVEQHLGQVVDGDQAKSLLPEAVLEEELTGLAHLLDEKQELRPVVMAVTAVEVVPGIDVHMAAVNVARVEEPDSLQEEIRERSAEFQGLRARLDGVLTALELPCVEISSRVKTPESIAAKLKVSPEKTLEDLTDLVAARVVVPDEDALAAATRKIAQEFGVEWEDAPGERVHMVVPRGSRPLEASTTDVEIQVLTVDAAAGALLQHWGSFKPSVRSKAAPAQEENPLITTLNRALEEFQGLISNPDVHEKRDIHPFIEENPFLLFPNPDATFSEVPIGMGTEHRIDFMVRRPDATYLLVELENPRHRITTQARDFSAEVNHALCQVEDWQEWMEGNLPMVQNYYPELTSPEGLVVIGRDVEDEQQTRRLRRRNVNMRGRIEILTYDDLVRGAESYIRSLEDLAR
jgi:ppGpp synthetase/RelA/SpoT-type nucleotidyltranferase